MYEGKNIHYSPVDQKPLCSFSGKICNQRRLNKYGFCVRHILEDPNAPFKRCAYVAKSSRQTCTQPIPKNEEREYCNNHMQVLGMLPKKVRKPKKERLIPATPDPLSSHPGAMAVPILLQSRTKPKLTVSGFKTKFGTGKISAMADMEDVYAFPTEVADKINRSSVSTMVTNVAIPDMSSSSTKTVTYSTFTTKTTGQEGAGSHSSLAKIYPELAEKLEKIKPKLADPKVRGKVKNSRTMNSLQTKIAQNKIKDKLKRNQSSSNASSQSQSPSHGFTNVNSPGGHVSPASSPNNPVPLSTPGMVHSLTNTKPAAVPATMVVQNHVNEQTSGVNVSANNLTSQQPIPGLSQFNLLNSLNLQTLNSSLAQLGFPVPTASDIEQTLQQLAKAANISLEGAPLSAEGSSQSHTSQPVMSVIPGLPGGGSSRPADLVGGLKPSFTSLSGPPPPYSSIHHKPTVPVTHSGAVPVQHSGATVPVPHSDMCVTDSVKPSLNPQLLGASTTVLQRPSLSEENISKLVPSVTALPNSSHSSMTSLQERKSLTAPSSTSSSNVVSSSTAQIESAKPSVNSAQLSKGPGTIDNSEPNVSNVSSQKQRPKVKSRSRNSSALSKRPVPVFTMPMTVLKPRKIRKILPDEELTKLNTKSAINYYKKYKLRKECNHDLIITGVDSSDDDSDLSDCDMLPWQPDWFIASSDEEGWDEDESDYDLRTTKLALVRAQLRRQCFQARLAYKSNLSVCQNNNETTSTLIQAAKTGAKFAVSALNQIDGKIQKPKDRYKTRGLERRQCLYKDDDEVQCKGIVVPYTNHCIKHVMYNVDQQLFEYCTAKFADNTQCCHPVIDLKHELPLCMEHGLKADNFLKTQEAEPKPKRPRKKTKPSALTRPPKKGKKKKNQRKAAQLLKAQSQASEETGISQCESDEDMVGNDSGTEAVDMEEGHVDMDDDADDDADTEKEESEMSTDVPSKSAILKQASMSVHRPVHPTVQSAAHPTVHKTGDQGVKMDTKPVIANRDEHKSGRHGSVNQLEELDNLTGIPELENVKMFGDLPLETASKLLEENDFQEVLNRLPDEAFDIFNKTSALPSNEELEELEKSLAMANRDLRYTKDSVDQLATSSTVQSASTQKHSAGPPSLDDTDDITRQIAEEILKQNIGTNSSVLESSVSHRDAQESIKAIARSLSTSGMLLTSDTSQRSQNEEGSVIQGQSSLSRSQSTPYSSIGQVFIPPGVSVHSTPQSNMVIGSQSNIAPGSVTHSLTRPAGSITTSIQPHIVPRNVTVMPQGMFQARLPVSAVLPVSKHLPISSHTVVQQTVGQPLPTHTVIQQAQGHGLSSQTSVHIDAFQQKPRNFSLKQDAVTSFSMKSDDIPGSVGNVVSHVITQPTLSTASSSLQATGAQLTAQQISQLVQQAALQLPPVPPYIPRPATPVSQATQHVNITLPTAQVNITHSTPFSQATQHVNITQATHVNMTLPTPQVPTPQVNITHPTPVSAITQASISQPTVAQPTALPTIQPSIQPAIQPSIQSAIQSAIQPSIAGLSHQQLQVQQQQLVRQRDQLTQHQQHLLTQQLLQQHLLALATQHSQQTQIINKHSGDTINNLQHVPGNQSKLQPIFTPSVNISALLQPTHKINNLPVSAMSSVLPIPQLIKANVTPSQSAPASANLTPVTLPTANIVWTSPPNVTITSSNGFTRNIIQGASSGGDSAVRTSSKLKQEETVIDLTDCNDTPSERTSVTHPAASFLSKQSTFGKS